MSMSAGRRLVFGCFGEFVSKHCGLTLLGYLQLRDSSLYHLEHNQPITTVVTCTCTLPGISRGLAMSTRKSRRSSDATACGRRPPRNQLPQSASTSAPKYTTHRGVHIEQRPTAASAETEAFGKDWRLQTTCKATLPRTGGRHPTTCGG